MKEGEYYYEQICQKCPSGTYIYKEGNTCVSECPQGYIGNTISNECDVKPPEKPIEPEKQKEISLSFLRIYSKM